MIRTSIAALARRYRKSACFTVAVGPTFGSATNAAGEAMACDGIHALTAAGREQHPPKPSGIVVSPVSLPHAETPHASPSVNVPLISIAPTRQPPSFTGSGLPGEPAPTICPSREGGG